MVFRHSIELAQMSFGLIPKILYPVDMIVFVCKLLRMVDAHMLKLSYIQHIIRMIRIRVNNAVWNNLFVHNVKQGVGFGVCNHLGVDFASSLEDAKYGHFSTSAPPTFAFSFATKITLIHFDLTCYRMGFYLLVNQLTKTMKIVGGCAFIYPNQSGCGPCGCACYKMFHQSILFCLTQSAFPHLAILAHSTLSRTAPYFKFPSPQPSPRWQRGN